jgi:hypothetical protein
MERVGVLESAAKRTALRETPACFVPWRLRVFALPSSDPLRGALRRMFRARPSAPSDPQPACAFGHYVGKRLDHIEDLYTWILRTLMAGVLVEVVGKFVK